MAVGATAGVVAARYVGRPKKITILGIGEAGAKKLQ
jgi:hypothetical protein